MRDHAACILEAVIGTGTAAGLRTVITSTGGASPISGVITKFTTTPDGSGATGTGSGTTDTGSGATGTGSGTGGTGASTATTTAAGATGGGAPRPVLAPEQPPASTTNATTRHIEPG